MTEEQARRREAIVRLITALLSLSVMLWYLTPEHHRQLATMRLAAASGRACGRLAKMLARQSMNMELVTGRQRYEAPYLLSLARDQAERWYERTRSVT